MGSAKGRLLRMFGSLVLGRGRVEAVDELGPQFRRFLVGETTTADDRYEPGDKLQILFPGADVRTYTPIGWSGGRTSLLAYLHGDTPAVAWARSLAVGDPVQYVGPQRSLKLGPGRAVIVGDETSIAVAAAFSLARPGQVAAVIEAADVEEARAVLAALGVADAVVVARGGSRIALVEAVVSAGGPVGLTGGARLIREVRAGLRERGAREERVKAYWAEGKVALD
jgi:NADPH-dependent ferric siderophore reductase